METNGFREGEWPRTRSGSASVLKGPKDAASHNTLRPGDSNGSGNSERLTAGPECRWVVEVGFWSTVV